MLGEAIITAEMFTPIIDGLKEVVPIAVGAGASVLGITWVARKGFSMVKSFMNKG